MVKQKAVVWALGMLSPNLARTISAPPWGFGHFFVQTHNGFLLVFREMPKSLGKIWQLDFSE